MKRRALARVGLLAVPVLVAAACASPTGSTPASSAAASSAAVTSEPSGSASPTVTASLPPHAPPTQATHVVSDSDHDLPDGGRLVTLGLPGGAYTPQAPSGGTDDYHCFLLDPGITADTFLTGVTVIPGNPGVVHHAILFRVPPASVPAAKAKDAESPQTGWTCFGDAGIPRTSTNPLEALNNAPWLAAWAPGGKETRFPAGTGVEMPKGTQIVLQIHYNLLAGGGPDASGVRLRLAKPGSDLTPLETMLLPAPVELPCAAGQTGPLCQRDAAMADLVKRFGKGAGRTAAGLQLLCGGDLFTPKAGDTQSCDRVITTPITAVAVAGHMHLLGRSITVQRVQRDGKVTTLLDIPVWDFDNQGAHRLPEPVQLAVGDKLRVTCTHDATLRDQIPELSKLADRYVMWGEGTSDEMCLGVVTYLAPH